MIAAAGAKPLGSRAAAPPKQLKINVFHVGKKSGGSCDRKKSLFGCPPEIAGLQEMWA